MLSFLIFISLTDDNPKPFGLNDDLEANTPTLLTVTYPVSYTNRPNLFVTPQTSIPEIISIAIGQGSTNYVDFGIYLTRTNTNATTIHWMSIGYKAP